jgi:conjugative transfer signal peptidase TraF
MAERRDLPLFAWGAARHAARRRRRRRARQAAALGLGCACLAATIVAPPQPRLLWNASASAPVGLWRVTPGGALARGDMVVANIPPGLRALAARRHYIPANVPLVKRVTALAGDRVCATGPLLTINGHPVAARRAADTKGRPLPWWSGCRTLGAGSLLLLMAGSPDSFDGRYFGPSFAADVIGKASPLWVG